MKGTFIGWMEPWTKLIKSPMTNGDIRFYSDKIYSDLAPGDLNLQASNVDEHLI